MTVELYPHQQKAVDKMHNGCILWGDVGVGKTLVALVYFYTKVCGGVVGDRGSMRNPRDLIIITTAKKRDSFDWETDANELSIGKERDGSVSSITLTVDSWNNIDKYTEVKDAFFIFDEQRVVGSGSWTKAFVEIAKHNQWILLSATPGDTWMDYIPVFLANGFYKNRTEFLRKHVVFKPYVKWPQVERYSSVPHLLKLRNSILVEMPYVRHTTREINYVHVDYDKELLNEKVMKKRWHVYEERPLRDVAELFLVMRKVVNADPSRLRAIRNLMEKHSKLIVFYNNDYELEKLRTLANPSTSTAPSGDSSNLQTLDQSAFGSFESGTTSQEKIDRCTSSGLMAQSRTQSKEDPWNYLLSPEGMAENERLLPEKSSKDFSGIRSPIGSGGGSELETPRNHSSSPLLEADLFDLGSTSSTNGQMARKLRKSSSVSGSSTSSDLVSGSECVISNPTSTEETSFAPAEGSEEWTKNQSVESSEKNSTTRDSMRSTTDEATTEDVPTDASTSTSFAVAERNGLSQTLVTDSADTQATHVPPLSDVTTNSASFAVAEWNGHKHQEIPKTDRWVYLVQYQAGAEGWNCIETDAMCFYSLTYSYKNWHQAFGRIDRLNTPFSLLKYYVLMSDSVIDKAVLRALKNKKNFNEAKFVTQL